MFGAIASDIIGSVYEFKSVKGRDLPWSCISGVTPTR